MEHPQELNSQTDLLMQLFEERTEVHLQQNLQFLNSQNDAVLDQELQQQILDDQDLELEGNRNSNAILSGITEKAKPENSCQFRQLQLQTELQSQQLQLEELDLTMEAVMIANEDISIHRQGKSLSYHAGHQVQSQLLPLAKQLQALLPHVQDLENDDTLLTGGHGAKCGLNFQHLRIQLGAIIYELSESLYKLEMQQMDVDWEFQQLEMQFSKQDLKLRALYHQIERLIEELSSARVQVLRASENTISMPNATDKILDVTLSEYFMKSVFHEMCLPEWEISHGAKNVVFAASAA